MNFEALFFFGKDFCVFLGEFSQEYGFLPPRLWSLLAFQLKSIWYVTSFFACVHVCVLEAHLLFFKKIWYVTSFFARVYVLETHL